MIIKEMRERETRKNNILFFNTPEPVSRILEERGDEDRDKYNIQSRLYCRRHEGEGRGIYDKDQLDGGMIP